MKRCAMAVAVAVCAGLLGACGPIGPIPGGRLSGEPGDPQLADWSFVSIHEQAQLETRPTDPHSVNVWIVGLGEHLYVPTSMIIGPKDPTRRSWAAHVAEDPDVRIRIAGRLYERRAVRVDDADEYATARAALEAKYALDEPDPERTIWIFRLDPRPADSLGRE